MHWPLIFTNFYDALPINAPILKYAIEHPENINHKTLYAHSNPWKYMVAPGIMLARRHTIRSNLHQRPSVDEDGDDEEDLSH